MKNLIFNKAFQLGFWIGFVSIVIFNLSTFTLPVEAHVHHYINTVGFPFAFYEWGGNPYVERISQKGLIADILVLLIYSFLVGLLFRFMWSQHKQSVAASN